MDSSTTTPTPLLLTNMSEIASPAAVVEILITQNSAVTSGTLAASGCWVNTRNGVRTAGLVSFGGWIGVHGIDARIGARVGAKHVSNLVHSTFLAHRCDFRMRG